MIETKQLRIFKAIADVGSFTRAGRRLNLSQSAISQQVRALEEQVGVPLLVRGTRRARPTPAGEVLLAYAGQLLEKLDEVERLLADHGEGRLGVLRIGAGGAACQHLLPPVLGEFRARHPQIELRVLSGHTRLTVSRILRGDLDLGLATLPVRAERLRVGEVGRDELVAVVPPDHRWAGQRRVQAKDFAGEPLVVHEPRSQTTDLILRFLLEEGVFPRVAMEINHLEAVKEMVRAGLGVAIVPRWAVRSELRTGSLSAVRLGRGGLVRSWGVVYRD